jgi:hypothetical protein
MRRNAPGFVGLSLHPVTDEPPTGDAVRPLLTLDSTKSAVFRLGERTRCEQPTLECAISGNQKLRILEATDEFSD